MKKIMIAAAALLCWMAASAQNFENKTFTEQEKPFADLSAKIWELMDTKDADALKEIFHEQCVFVHMGGYWGTEQELKTIGEGIIWYKHAEVYGAEVKIVDENTACVYSTITLDAQVGPQDTSHPFFVTQVFRNVNGKWKLVSFVFTTRIFGPGEINAHS